MMVSHPKATRPWEVISADLMGPLPRSKAGNSFILVVTDYLSKFALVFPLRRSSAELVVRKLEEDVFLLFGVPRVLIVDNGPQFRGKQLQKLAQTYRFKIKYSANYHPRANPTERTINTLKTMLSIYTNDNHRLWDVNLQQIACAIRTARHDSVRLTPYYINFGRNMAISGEDYAQRLDIDEESQTGETSRNEAFRQIFRDVNSRLIAAAKRSCGRYNLRRRYESFEPGQLVWKRNYVLSNAAQHFSAKLAPKFIGPFQIHQKVSPWTYVLKHPNGNVLPGTWHIKDLKCQALSEN